MWPTVERRRAFEIGNRTRYLQNAIVRPGAESLLLHGSFKQSLGIGRQFAEEANLPSAHLRVGIDLLFRRVEANPLPLPGREHAVANLL